MKFFPLILILLFNSALFSEDLFIASWNIEHFGSPGRGLGYKNLPMRNAEDLQQLGELILQLDLSVLAIQEVAIHQEENGIAKNYQLDTLLETLGPSWQYQICPNPQGIPQENSFHNMQNAYLWNNEKLYLENIFALDTPSITVGRKNTFDRSPYAAWFSCRYRNDRGNDFLLVNLHLTSGQDNDENHLAAMVMVEQALNPTLRDLDITESDRIILGDFNDDPWAEDDRGRLEHMDFLYRYMEYKGYQDLSSSSRGFTRMNDQLDSAIDHILINSSARRHYGENSFYIYRPSVETLEEYQQWRETYSDHFPLIFALEVRRDDDND